MTLVSDTTTAAHAAIMLTWRRPIPLEPVLLRLDKLEDGVMELRAGQDGIVHGIEKLRVRDGEIEDKLASAMDRMTEQMRKSAADQMKSAVDQIEMFRATLVETQVRRAWVVVRGRGLKWGERVMWLALAGAGKLLWNEVGTLHNWNQQWWWPSW